MRRLLMLVTLTMVVLLGAAPTLLQPVAASQAGAVANAVSAPLIPCSNGVPMPC